MDESTLNLFDPPHYRTPTECQLLDKKLNLFTDWLLDYLDDPPNINVLPNGHSIVVLFYDPYRFYGLFTITDKKINHKYWKLVEEYKGQFIYSWNNEHLENK